MQTTSQTSMVKPLSVTASSKVNWRQVGGFLGLNLLVVLRWRVSEPSRVS